MRVLLVEDERYLAEALVHLLKRAGYEADWAEDGEAGLRFARNDVYDIIILDNMLPKLSGIEVLRSLRKEKSTTPILMLSAKSETTDKVEGLEVGADDYLAKPFKTNELIARLRAITRRHEHGTAKDSMQVGDLTISMNNRTIAKEDAIVELTAKEYDIFDMLVQSQGKLVHTEALFRRAWGSTVFVEPTYIYAYISYLRAKLKQLGSYAKIKAVRGVGYKLITENGDVS